MFLYVNIASTYRHYIDIISVYVIFTGINVNLMSATRNMMDKLKLRVKASDYELEAEGSRDFLNEQYEAFKQLLEDVTQKPVASRSREKIDIPSQRASKTPPLPEKKTVEPLNSQTKSFQKLLVWNDRTQRVKSTVLPDGPTRIADTVLLLLLGYRELRGLNQISALLLNQGLKSAGLDDYRLDRELAPYLKARLVLRSGTGKGSRYRLTTRGVKRAQELVQTLSALIP
ncbi:MAG: hypothetical protein OXB94_06425 [Nitrospira sp.]|nr:hypothetical protein [Nitrospira sp.]